MTVDSCTLYAPACTVQFALDHYEPAMTNGVLRKQDFHVELLSDERELGDTVGPYGTLAALSREPRARGPAQDAASSAWPTRGIRRSATTWSNDPVIQRGLKAWQTFWGTVRAPREVTESQISNGVPASPSSHGGFDNDVDVVTRTIERIAGQPLKHPVEAAGLP